jgi:hypothetical protein
MARSSTVVTYSICGTAVATLLLAFGRLVILGVGRSGFSLSGLVFVLIIFFWTVVPYAALIAAAAVSARQAIAATTIAIGSAPISAIGIWAMKEVLTPLPPGAKNCVGPIPLLLSPLYQLEAAIALVVVAWVAQAAATYLATRTA